MCKEVDVSKFGFTIINGDLAANEDPSLGFTTKFFLH